MKNVLIVGLTGPNLENFVAIIAVLGIVLMGYFWKTVWARADPALTTVFHELVSETPIKWWKVAMMVIINIAIGILLVYLDYNTAKAVVITIWLIMLTIFLLILHKEKENHMLMFATIGILVVLAIVAIKFWIVFIVAFSVGRFIGRNVPAETGT